MDEVNYEGKRVFAAPGVRIYDGADHEGTFKRYSPHELVHTYRSEGPFVLLSDYENLLQLVDELADKDTCHYDHHDYCQTHLLQPRPCPHERARHHRKHHHKHAQHTEAIKVKFETPTWIVGAEEEMP